jgi:hypothetical protein
MSNVKNASISYPETGMITIFNPAALRFAEDSNAGNKIRYAAKGLKGGK